MAIPGFVNNLLDNVSADTDGEAMPIQDKGYKNLYIQAEDFGGGTVSLEWTLTPEDDTSWTVANDPSGNPLSVTGNSMYTSLSLYGAYYRATLSGSTDASNVCVRLV